jgi:hypothetical protein
MIDLRNGWKDHSVQQSVQQPLQQRWGTGETAAQDCKDQNDRSQRPAINAGVDREKMVGQWHAVFIA